MFFNFPGRRKWVAWNSLKGLAKDAAMNRYVTTVKDIQAAEELKAP